MSETQEGKTKDQPKDELFDITEEVEKLFVLLSTLKIGVETEIKSTNPNQDTIMDYLVTITQLTDDWRALLSTDKETSTVLEMYHYYALENLPVGCDLLAEKKKRTPAYTEMTRQAFEKAGLVQKKQNILMNEIKDKGLHTLDLVFTQAEIVGDAHQVLMIIKHLKTLITKEDINDSAKYHEVVDSIAKDMLQIIEIHDPK
jgi:hypothetical protein